MTDEEINDFISELGADMRAARDERAVTQRELAARMRTNQGQIHLLESASGNPTIASILRFYDGLDMDVIVMGLKRKKKI